MTINIEKDYVIRIEDENKKLKERIDRLVSENVKLQNDLFTEQLNEDESDDYIDKLKNELFQIYINKRYWLDYTLCSLFLFAMI